MEIEIVSAESLGVRSLCTVVSTRDRKILIDPGLALGYTRFRLLPHPLQVAVDERIQKRIIHEWSTATDIVISHFHGDHVPLAASSSYESYRKRKWHDLQWFTVIIGFAYSSVPILIYNSFGCIR